MNIGRHIRGLFYDMSNGRLSLTQMPDYMTVQVAGPYKFEEFSKSQDCNTNYLSWQRAARERARQDGYDLSKFGTVVTIAPYPTFCLWAGRATLSGRCLPGSNGGSDPPCQSLNLICRAYVVGHELGHNLGMQHAAIDTDDNDVVPASATYLDYSDLMGNRDSWTRLNAPHMIAKGYLAAPRVLKVTTSTASGFYQLRSLDTSDATAGSDVSALYLTDRDTAPSKTYFLALRTAQSYAQSLAGLYLGGVNVHYYRSDSEYTHYVTTLKPGDKFVTPGKRFGISVVSVDNVAGVATIQLTTSGTGGAYSWSVSPWSMCSASCGVGVQTRSVTCQSTSGSSVAVADALCVPLGARPVTAQVCTAPMCNTFSWRTTAWSSCSVTCGKGLQWRTVFCVSNEDGAAQQDAACLPTASKPPTTQECSSDACPTFSWRVGAWSACPATCGTGVQIRSVQCRGSDNTVAADNFCTVSGAKPVNAQLCSASPCVSHAWSAAEWVGHDRVSYLD